MLQNVAHYKWKIPDENYTKEEVDLCDINNRCYVKQFILIKNTLIVY